MSSNPYISPPPPSPPPPSPPQCNHTVPPPPPPPPPPNCTIPPPPSCCVCQCICPPSPPPPPRGPAPPPYHWPPAPTPYSPPVPGPNHEVYIAVFVSLGGVFFLAFLAAGLFCIAKRRKKVIIPPPVEAAACVEEHQHIQETITSGPCGEQTVTLTVDDDVRLHEAAEVGAAAAAVCTSHAIPPDYDHRPAASYREGHHFKAG